MAQFANTLKSVFHSKSDEINKSDKKEEETSTNCKIRYIADTHDEKQKLECVDAEIANYRFGLNDLDGAIEYLLQNGYVVIKNVLNSSEIEHGKNLLWKYLRSFGWKKDDYTTWKPYDIGGEIRNGILWERSGQSDFAWYGRTHPNVLKIFGDLWSHKELENKTIDPRKDLLTSFDGLSIFYPWYLNEYMKTNAGWYHIDQNVDKKPGIQTVQGYISYFDQNESTGSTVLIPKTHKLVKQQLSIGKWRGDFIRIPKQHKLLSEHKKILLCCKAGDFLLWDSRCIHCNSPALLSKNQMKDIHFYKRKTLNDLYNANNSKTKQYVMKKIDSLLQTFETDKDYLSNVDLLRAVSYICMVPKSKLRNKNVIKMRIRAYQQNATTSHWPIDCAILGIDRLQLQNKIENADDLTKSLIGMNTSIKSINENEEEQETGSL